MEPRAHIRQLQRKVGALWIVPPCFNRRLPCGQRLPEGNEILVVEVKSSRARGEYEVGELLTRLVDVGQRPGSMILINLPDGERANLRILSPRNESLNELD